MLRFKILLCKTNCYCKESEDAIPFVIKELWFASVINGSVHVRCKTKLLIGIEVDTPHP